jgi:hypothetical protein
MERFATGLAATIGLTVSIGPVLIAQLVPRVDDLKLLGISILGTLIGMSACARR